MVESYEEVIIPPNAFSQSSGMNLYKIQIVLKDRLHYIRHAAVHRKPTFVESLKKMLADSQLLTNSLRDVPRSNKLRAMALAMEFYDIKEMEATITAPVSTFHNSVNSQSLRTEAGHFGNEVQQKENVGPIHTERSRGREGIEKILEPSHRIRFLQLPGDTQAFSQQPGVVDPLQLERQSSDRVLSTANPNTELGKS